MSLIRFPVVVVIVYRVVMLLLIGLFMSERGVSVMMILSGPSVFVLSLSLRWVFVVCVVSVLSPSVMGVLSSVVPGVLCLSGVSVLCLSVLCVRSVV